MTWRAAYMPHPTHLGVLPCVEGGQEEAVLNVERLQSAALLQRAEARGGEVGGAAVARKAACGGGGRGQGQSVCWRWIECRLSAGLLVREPLRGLSSMPA